MWDTESMVFANIITSFLIAHYFCCAAVSIGYALDFAVGTHRWTLLVVDQIGQKADSVKIRFTGDTDPLDQCS